MPKPLYIICSFLKKETCYSYFNSHVFHGDLELAFVIWVLVLQSSALNWWKAKLMKKFKKDFWRNRSESHDFTFHLLKSLCTFSLENTSFFFGFF